METGTTPSQWVLVSLEEVIPTIIARASEMEYPKKKFCYWWPCTIENHGRLSNKWSMAKVTVTKSDQDGLVRSVYLKLGDRPEREKAKNIVEWPVDKIVLLLEINVFVPHQGTNWCFVINLVVTREVICNCTLIKCNLEQSAR